MTKLDDIVPSLVNAEIKFQKVLSNKKATTKEITKAEQDFNEAVLNTKTEFDKAVSKLTAKYGKCLITTPQFSRRGAVHAR